MAGEEQLLPVGFCTTGLTWHLQELEKWLEGKGWQAVRPAVGRVQGPDCTTWIRHCSTCLLISSSLPANGALHSGHTWPPSSGFLLFIFPIRAGKAQREREKEGTWFKLSKLPRMFLRITSLFWGEISGILCQMILNKPDQYDSSLQANRSFKGSLCVCHVLICDTLNLLPTHYSYETCFHPFASFLFLPFPPVPSPPTPLPHTHI